MELLQIPQEEHLLTYLLQHMSMFVVHSNLLLITIPRYLYWNMMLTSWP